MAEMAEKEYKVYLKEVNWYRTTVTAACEEDAKDRAKEEHEYRETFEDYEEGHATFADSSLDFLTETEMAEGSGTIPNCHRTVGDWAYNMLTEDGACGGGVVEPSKYSSYLTQIRRIWKYSSLVFVFS